MRILATDKLEVKFLNCYSETENLVLHKKTLKNTLIIVVMFRGNTVSRILQK